MCAKETVQMVGVKPDGTSVSLGQVPMPPKMKAIEIVEDMFGLGQIDEHAGNDAAMALWCCEQLIAWMESQK